MPWYKVTLTTDDVIAHEHMRLQDAFTKIFVASGGPKDAGMFCGMGVDDNGYYFSPGAANIALVLIARYKGEECPAPSRKGLCLLVCEQSMDRIPFSD